MSFLRMRLPRPSEVQVLSVERHGAVVVVRDVPADVCTTCGEEYLSAAVLKELEAAVEQAQGAGVDVAVRHYKAA